ncbi:hypothetical protein [Variovorax sp. ZT4R33]|uniref:hypothetical protein n=1 Tax=Variovorax sp. ZT4R33 TaxID=3443743 RepID=UPI003F48FCD4
MSSCSLAAGMTVVEMGAVVGTAAMAVDAAPEIAGMPLDATLEVAGRTRPDRPLVRQQVLLAPQSVPLVLQSASR